MVDPTLHAEVLITGRVGKASTRFTLPDGQRVEVMIYEDKQEHIPTRWEFVAWTLDDHDRTIRRVASFNLPIDSVASRG